MSSFRLSLGCKNNNFYLCNTKKMHFMPINFDQIVIKDAFENNLKHVFVNRVTR